MNLAQTVRDSLYPYEEGKTVNITCPECNKAKKLSATVNGNGILFNCYSASCGVRGKLGINLSAVEKIELLKKRHEKVKTLPWTTPSYWIEGIGDNRCLEYMKSKHLMQAYKDNVFRPLYDPAEQRFVFPIRNFAGEIVGAIGRTLIGAEPKVLNYNRRYTLPFICGWRPGILLVEDCASAVAATRSYGIAGMALLGTSVRPEFVPHLTKFKWVGIALDPDAYKKSFKMKKYLETYIKDVRILKLSKDIKDMSDEEYMEFMNDVC